MDEKKLSIAMLGHKHMLSREGGIEIVVKELATRMSKHGHSVTVYDRKTHHVSGAQIDTVSEYEGVKIKEVLTIDKKGLAAMTSSFSAAWRAAWSSADVIHIHAEGPAAMSGLVKYIWSVRGQRKKKRLVVTVHGACEIMGSTGKKPVKSRLYVDSVFYPNSYAEYHIKNIYSGILKRFCVMPKVLWYVCRAFFCWNSLLNPQS